MRGMKREHMDEDDALVVKVQGGGRGAFISAIPRRVLISHEELGLLVVRPSVGVPPPAEGCFLVCVEASRIQDISPLANHLDQTADS
jgi:hypothetical protein